MSGERIKIAEGHPGPDFSQNGSLKIGLVSLLVDAFGEMPRRTNTRTHTHAHTHTHLPDTHAHEYTHSAKGSKLLSEETKCAEEAKGPN